MPAPSLPIISTFAALLANAALASGPVDALARAGSAELREHDVRVDSLKAELTGLPLVPEAQNVARVGWHSRFSDGERAAAIFMQIGQMAPDSAEAATGVVRALVEETIPSYRSTSRVPWRMTKIGRAHV